MQSSLSLVAVGFTFRKGPEHFYLVVGEKCLTSLSSQISFGRKGLVLLGIKETVGLSHGIMHGSHGEAKLASFQAVNVKPAETVNFKPAEMRLLVPLPALKGFVSFKSQSHSNLDLREHVDPCVRPELSFRAPYVWD
uniref:Uncharacterized protein n=1 Tax=Sphaerodactylus townsendi TaxID=933632 RepID=A0ACB8F0L9_9SAUR